MAGFTLLLGGMAMLVLPGPAFAVIPIGLAILGARVRLGRAAAGDRDREGREGQAVGEGDEPHPAIVVAIAVALAIVAAVAASILWEIPVVPYTCRATSERRGSGEACAAAFAGP